MSEQDLNIRTDFYFSCTRILSKLFCQQDNMLCYTLLSEHQYLRISFHTVDHIFYRVPYFDYLHLHLL